MFRKLTILPLLISAVIGGVAMAGDHEAKKDGNAGNTAVVPEPHLIPVKLKPADVLTDGPNGKRIPIEAETTLIWVDRMPGWRFMHPTEYILILAGKTEVIKGSWWPVLNNKSLLPVTRPQPTPATTSDDR